MALSFVTPVVGSAILTSEVVGTGTSVTVNEPANTAPGDFLFLYAAASAAGAIVTPVPGFVSISTLAGTAATAVVAIARRGASAASAVITLTGSVYREIYLAALHSNTTWPVYDSRSSAVGGVQQLGPFNPDPPIIAAQGNPLQFPAIGQGPGIYIAFGLWWGGSGTGGWTPPTGYTSFSGNAAGDDLCMAYKAFTNPAAEDPGPFANATGTLTTDTWNGMCLAFTDAQPTYYRVGNRVVQRAPSNVTNKTQDFA